MTLSGDLAIADRTVEYGSNRSYYTAITEIEDGKVKRLDNTSRRFEAPQWRAQQAEKNKHNLYSPKCLE